MSHDANFTPIYFVDQIFTKETGTYERQLGLVSRKVDVSFSSNGGTLHLQYAPAFVGQSFSKEETLDSVLSEYLHSVANDILFRNIATRISQNPSMSVQDIQKLAQHLCLHEEQFIEAIAAAYVHAFVGEDAGNMLSRKYDLLGGKFENVSSLLKEIQSLNEHTYLAPFIHYASGEKIPISVIAKQLDKVNNL